jgi:hypothetical protein
MSCDVLDNIRKEKLDPFEQQDEVEMTRTEFLVASSIKETPKSYLTTAFISAPVK